MAKASKTPPPKKAQRKRAATYEKPVKFEGTFEDMVIVSTTGAGAKTKKETEGEKK